jgi:hypothetical protein
MQLSTVQTPSSAFMQTSNMAVIENKEPPKSFNVRPNPFHDPKFIEEAERRMAERHYKAAEKYDAMIKMNSENPVSYAVSRNPLTAYDGASGYKVKPNTIQISPEVKKSNLMQRFAQVRQERAKNMVYDQSVMNAKPVENKDLMQQLQSLDQTRLQQLLNLLQPLPAPSLTVTGQVELVPYSVEQVQLQEPEINFQH